MPLRFRFLFRAFDVEAVLALTAHAARHRTTKGWEQYWAISLKTRGLRGTLPLLGVRTVRSVSTVSMTWHGSNREASWDGVAGA